MGLPSLYDDEPFGGDQWLEDQEYEANARYDYIREAYGPSAEGLEDDPHLMHDEEREALTLVRKASPFIGPFQPIFGEDDEIPF
jgi:hypothetical protein